MCGIAGVMWWDPGMSGRAVEAARAMRSALSHRGPDGDGTWASDRSAAAGVALGHTRLAVIDLSDEALQPMRRGHHAVAYNGEIYNYRALRRELGARGAEFSTESDTETLLEAWRAWGQETLDRLDGMFAFAIWDDQRRELTLARDRFGIKPLYVMRTEGGLVFSSEIRALLTSGLARPRLNRKALSDYLAFQTAATPATLVAGVDMLQPGSVMVVDANGVSTSRRYWELLDSASGSESTTGKTARADVQRLLEKAVHSHLVSDVPVGLFLSGGVDSSALLSCLHAAGVAAQTYSVTFEEAGYDESAFSRAAAQAFGADHTEFRLSEAELLDALPAFLASVDHPSGDGVNTFVISRLARQRGLKVAWSGLGGDELFGGYPSFRRLATSVPLFRQWARLPEPVRRVAADVARRGTPASVALDKITEAARGDGTFASLWPITRQLFGPEDRARLLGDEAAGASRVQPPYVALLADAAERFPEASLGALVSYAETRTYMHDVLLRDADQMSMAHGLEVRVPLLDHHLAEYLVALPDEIRLGGAYPKALLVESLASPLPERLVKRPKRGFTLPFDLWMRTELRALVERHLGSNGLEGRAVFRPGAVTRIWHDFLAGKGNVTWARIWILVALDAWLERVGMEVAA